MCSFCHEIKLKQQITPSRLLLTCWNLSETRFPQQCAMVSPFLIFHIYLYLVIDHICAGIYTIQYTCLLMPTVSLLPLQKR